MLRAGSDSQIVHTVVRAKQQAVSRRDEVWGPSAVPDPVSNEIPKEVSGSEIVQLVEAYAAAALRSKRAGFDVGATAWGSWQWD